ncbi:unnamed protein product, partial [Cyprideis torosa]
AGVAERVTFNIKSALGPACSPVDPYELALVADVGNGGQVATMNAYNQKLTVVSDTRWDEQPSFAPNGRMLIFSSKRGGKQRLAIASSDGLARQFLEFSRGDALEPAWGPLLAAVLALAACSSSPRPKVQQSSGVAVGGGGGGSTTAIRRNTGGAGAGRVGQAGTGSDTGSGGLGGAQGRNGTVTGVLDAEELKTQGLNGGAGAGGTGSNAAGAGAGTAGAGAGAGAGQNGLRGAGPGGQSLTNNTLASTTPLDPSRYNGFSSVGELLSNNVIYFNYDSYEITVESRRILEAHSTFLLDNPKLVVSLEGHADERGTREYNLTLGEERAKAAQILMARRGVPNDRSSTVSWGEERPLEFACATRPTPKVEGQPNASPSTGGANTGTVDNPSRLDTDRLRTIGIGEGDPYQDTTPLNPDRYNGYSSVGELKANNVIFFDYNSYAISEQSRRVLQAHANFLVDYPELKASVEGHADERGTREYNIALGEYRAFAVRDVLSANGVSEARLEAVSWGEERPLEIGADEYSYARNRRVELNYQ